MKKKTQIRAKIKYYMTLRHVRTLQELREAIGVGSSHTLQKYLDDPGKIPIGVMVRIMDFLGVPADDRPGFFGL